MPNRVLRDWTDSDRVNLLGAEAERLFVRIIMKADDFGRYFADAKRLKAFLFPLNDQVQEADIERWLAECGKIGVVRFYEADGKRFLEVIKFGQRLRNMRNVYPAPGIGSLSTPEGEGGERESAPGGSKSPSGNNLSGSTPPQVAANGGESRPESEVESESESESEGRGNVPPQVVCAEIPTVEQAIAETVNAGIPPDFVRYVYADWSSRQGKDAAGNPVRWLPYITKRWMREQVEWRSGMHRGRRAGPGPGQGAVKPPRPAGAPVQAEVQAYAREKWGDERDWMLWAVQFYHYWNDAKRYWRREGSVIDWKVELGKSVATRRTDFLATDAHR